MTRPAAAASPLATVTRIRSATAARAVPRLRAGVLVRERLVRRLAQAADIPLVLLVAPAGYGKTTLLGQWTRAERRPSRWITCAEGDDDPARVVAMIALALGDLRGGRPGRLGTTGTLVAVSRGLERITEPCVLVLDDAHHLRSPGALAALISVAELLPDGAQLVLSCREEPALPIGRLRTQGQLVDFRTRDLAMTRGEATKMLALAGLELPPEAVLVLHQRTQGWPAGLYLAALSVRACTDRRGAADAFDGDDRLVADYLRDELLASLEDRQREFLRSAAVLDTLTGPLCDAVLESNGSGEVLRRLSRANALLSTLDSTDATYRCHPMLARMLRAELRRTDPQLESSLHRRASAWYAANGDLDRATSHAIDAGDVDRAGTLLWAVAAEHVLDGRRATVERWLERLGRDTVATQPALALSAAACHLAAGRRDLVEHWADAAERAAGETEDAAVRSGILLMRAAVARNGIAQMDVDAARAYELAPQDSPWRAFACLLRGVAAHLRGMPQPARAQLEEGARRGAVGAPAVQTSCLAQLALLAVESGDWEEGLLLVARAMAQVERRELSAEPMTALVLATSAMIRAHRERVEPAQADRRRATELLDAVEEHVPWFEVETRVALARAALRLGDVTGARTLQAEASRMAPRAGDVPVLRAWIEELWDQLEAFSATALVGPSSLTTAELRVLALLPTHLSFREMGRRLHVSSNTIKTHAHAVYRKLDVCSRSEAVVRASETGLLDLKEELPCPSS